MAAEGVSLSQILTVLGFLSFMVLVLVIIRRNKEPLVSKLHGGKRVELLSNTNIGQQQSLKLVRIDDREFVLIGNKNETSHFYALTAASSAANPQALVSNPNQNVASTELQVC